jgi:hypothetical protein
MNVNILLLLLDLLYIFLRCIMIFYLDILFYRINCHFLRTIITFIMNFMYHFNIHRLILLYLDDLIFSLFIFIFLLICNNLDLLNDNYISFLMRMFDYLMLLCELMRMNLCQVTLIIDMQVSTKMMGA